MVCNLSSALLEKLEKSKKSSDIGNKRIESLIRTLEIFALMKIDFNKENLLELISVKTASSGSGFNGFSIMTEGMGNFHNTKFDFDVKNPFFQFLQKFNFF